MSPEVKDFLDRAGVLYRVHAHPPRIAFEEHVADPSFDPTEAVKSLAFRLPDARYAIVGLRARSRADYKRIADALGVRRGDLRAATAEELAADLDMQPGGVSPLPLKEAIVLLDIEIVSPGKVYCGSGRNDATIEISGHDLSRVANAIVCQVSRSE